MDDGTVVVIVGVGCMDEAEAGDSRCAGNNVARYADGNGGFFDDSTGQLALFYGKDQSAPATARFNADRASRASACACHCGPLADSAFRAQ